MKRQQNMLHDNSYWQYFRKSKFEFKKKYFSNSAVSHDSTLFWKDKYFARARTKFIRTFAKSLGMQLKVGNTNIQISARIRCDVGGEIRSVRVVREG